MMRGAERRRRPKRRLLLGVWLAAAVSVGGADERALAVDHDFSVLRINEVIPQNSTQTPRDGSGEYRDMVEIYNSGDKALPLGTSNPKESLALTQTETPDPTDANDWFYFPAGGIANIAPGDYVVVFLDNRPKNSLPCQLYSGFALKSDGSEPLVLWGPVTGEQDGQPVREMIDRVWLPRLPENSSFGRSPNGAGPAPMPVEETLTYFRFFPPGQTTFGECETRCPQLPLFATCTGAPNGEGGNLRPDVERVGHSTNHPAAGEAVEVSVRVVDDKDPTPGNIASVRILYWVDGVEQTPVDMSYDAELGIITGASKVPPRPLDRWSIWRGAIPGQSSGSIVEFVCEAADAEGEVSQDPGNLCADLELDPPVDVQGPCDREFGGPGCVIDAADTTCGGTVVGERYIACSVPFRYAVGYEPAGLLASLAINELVPRQGLELDRNGDFVRVGVLRDVTGRACTSLDACPSVAPDCCQYDNDFMELHNGGSEAVDVSGMWLSDSPFHPQGWQFPVGSVLAPGEYLIVWLDSDGGQCPDPLRSEPPCFWECPDPTDPSVQEYHTNFSIDANGDELYLFDREEAGFGVIHGLEFVLDELFDLDALPPGVDPILNKALALVPDGDPRGVFRVMESTPREPNSPCSPDDPVFLRGDTNGDCAVDITDGIVTLNYLFVGGEPPSCDDAADSDDDGELLITDAIFVLNFLFVGGTEPPDPGPSIPGCDPTPDELTACLTTCR